ncbi:hypothetical protein BDV93DRAFT_606302 [Ceratobasidium sp. AG-I]|nr:hypothetical protein BDV93DRAFT_606302 [Ceratobasidium sp. AG-I]
MSRNHTALAYQPQEGVLHSSISPSLARAFDGFFGPPARELKKASPPPSGRSSRKNHTALAPTPCPGVSPEMKRAFDGFFGPPAREQASAPPSPDRMSIDTLPEYRARDIQSPLPVYSVFGRSS